MTEEIVFFLCVVGCSVFPWLVIIHDGGLAHRKKPGTKKTQEAQVLVVVSPSVDRYPEEYIDRVYVTAKLVYIYPIP